ncbi:uncharacterized protein LOC134207499 [Armigeres subalbatus]|uniref:uncharacterized protein LOC134207499 n=1 Tax=Armigeres subalbatus TaxID=124917 RepID=UPI002ED3EAF4
MAIRRLVCRRGSPLEFFSDNGTKFVGASKELEKIEEECSENFTNARTRWNFNPPAAPHMGGVWERLVRSVKEAVYELQDGRSLSDEVLETVLAEAEGIINSRPLTFVSKENTDPEALTPNHFAWVSIVRKETEGYPKGMKLQRCEINTRDLKCLLISCGNAG